MNDGVVAQILEFVDKNPQILPYVGVGLGVGMMMRNNNQSRADDLTDVLLARLIDVEDLRRAVEGDELKALNARMDRLELMIMKFIESQGDK